MRVSFNTYCKKNTVNLGDELRHGVFRMTKFSFTLFLIELNVGVTSQTYCIPYKGELFLLHLKNIHGAYFLELPLSFLKCHLLSPSGACFLLGVTMCRLSQSFMNMSQSIPQPCHTELFISVLFIFLHVSICLEFYMDTSGGVQIRKAFPAQRENQY